MTLNRDVRSLFGTLARAEDLSGPPTSLLSPGELHREPLKWLKYLVMDRVGVESITTVSRQIHRFEPDRFGDAQRWVRRLFNDRGQQSGLMVVLKVVPWHRGAQLQNFRIQSEDEITKAFVEIESKYAGSGHELWCCESSVSASGFNLGGRLTFPPGGSDQVLELVWFGSPRLIETVVLPAFDRPYLRARRSPCSPQFLVECLHIPRGYSDESYTGRDPNPWEEDFREVLRELDRRDDAMRTLVRILRGIGAKETCYCFKVSEGRLTVIDWDTEIESSAQ